MGERASPSPGCSCVVRAGVCVRVRAGCQHCCGGGCFEREPGVALLLLCWCWVKGKGMGGWMAVCMLGRCTLYRGEFPRVTLQIWRPSRVKQMRLKGERVR